jgi:hypothetical protein
VYDGGVREWDGSVADLPAEPTVAASGPEPAQSPPPVELAGASSKS